MHAVEGCWVLNVQNGETLLNIPGIPLADSSLHLAPVINHQRESKSSPRVESFWQIIQPEGTFVYSPNSCLVPE